MMSYLICFLAVVSILTAGAARAEASQKLQQAMRAEAAFNAALKRDDALLPGAEYSAFVDAQKPLLQLRVDNKTYLPTTVYFGDQIKNKYQVNTIYADDTIHATEGFGFVAVPWRTNENISFVSEWPLERLERIDFFAGAPGPMHDKGYAIVRKVRRDGQKLIYTPPASGWKHDLIFCILRVKGEKLFRKFVFVLVEP